MADKSLTEPVVDEDIKNLRDFAVLGEPVVGVDVVTLDERGQGAHAPASLPPPPNQHLQQGYDTLLLTCRTKIGVRSV